MISRFSSDTDFVWLNFGLSTHLQDVNTFKVTIAYIETLLSTYFSQGPLYSMSLQAKLWVGWLVFFIEENKNTPLSPTVFRAQIEENISPPSEIFPKYALTKATLI